MHSPDELKTLVDEALERLDLWPELHGQATSVRYALEVGGKRVRPVIALAVGEALGAPVEQVMSAALAIELVHTFSLVHDDLPAMDDDAERRGHPSTWKKFGEGVGVLAGDALLAEAVRLAARYESSAVARELAEATLGMIGGQYLDTMVDGYDLAAVHRLKTGRLFYASVTMALWAAELPEEEQAPWRGFAEELGLLFQIVDDILDARRLRARARRRGCAALRRRGRGTGARTARRGRYGHGRPARHRRRSRSANCVSFDELLEVARAREDVLGVYVFGSRGRDYMVDERSDWDVCVVLADPEARDEFAREFPFGHGARVEIVAATLDELRANPSEHGRYAAAHAQVVLDKTGGELTRVVAEQESLPSGSRSAVVRDALDGYINQTYRSLRYGTRLDAVEAIPYALRTIFALENRVRPYNKYLEWELRHHRLEYWDADELLPLLDRVLTGEPEAQRELFNRVEPLARRAGFGDVVDGWEPDLDWLRGTAEYRA